jgi:dTDP-4-dehydrorhamnose reductase
MTRILIFGSKGMLGHVLFKYLTDSKKYDIVNSENKVFKYDSHYPVDARNKNEVEKYLKKIKPDIVINCIGILVKDSEKNIEDAILINSLFPILLSRLGDQLNFKLIHVSTDCVFSGKKGNYSEISISDAESIYGRSKSLGEFVSQKSLVIRTSIIGPELKTNGSGLFNWFLHQTDEVEGYKNALWTGVTTLELAKAFETFITLNISGIFHFVSKEKISKYELLRLIKNIWKKEDLIITPNRDYKTDKSLLNNRTNIEIPIKTYVEMLNELYLWIKANNSLYPDYQ